MIEITNQTNSIMRKLLVLLCLTMSSYLLSAQTVTVKVTDSKTGDPVTNASATVRGSGKGASANNDGIIKLQAAANAVLEITCVGYKPQLVKLTGSSEVSVSLEASSVDLGDIVIIGSRGAGRAKTETAVPVDVIKINQVGLPTAKMDLTSVLNMAAPSFNYNKQSGADGADHLDFGTLRGLGPDQTLVLINGKRRHQTAFVALFGTRGRGASGTDMNAFPESSVDRIEILRDGASAQYGSDAMAGVINIRLRTDVNHWTISTGWAGFYDTKFNALKSEDPSQYYTGHKIDGSTFTFSVNNGLQIGKSGGFANFSFDYLDQGKTFRQAPSNDITQKDGMLINSGRRAFGDGSVQTDGLMMNMELPIKGTKAMFYSFGGYNHKNSDAYAYSRNYSEKPERFPTSSSNTLIFVPGIMHVSSTNDTFYNPHIGTNINDASIALGFKGVSANNWNWDVSFTDGRNDFQYYGDGTFNASLLGNVTKTHFDDGGFKFRQATANLDFSKSFKSVLSGLNFAFGAEYRNEKYGINMGEEGSYAIYDTVTRFNGKSLAGGSQGFPGFSPADTVTDKRSSIALYLDGELNITSKWLLDAAVRYENYSDFGNVVTYKLATRYKITSNFNLRASGSTGFRAPSLQQSNFSNTLTSFSGGQLVQSRIARNGSELANAAGIPALKQETSINASLGFSWKMPRSFTLTIDGYMVKVKDRVVLSGLFDNSLSPAFGALLNSLNVTTAQFFTNAVNTTNYGLDIVLDYNHKLGKGNIKALLAGNIQNVTIDKIHVPALLNDTYLHQKTFFSDREEAFVKASAPKEKIALSVDYSMKKFGVGAHLTYFGKVSLLGFGLDGTGINPMVPSDADPNVNVPEVFNYKGKLVTDLYVSYKFCKAVSLFIGCDNLLNAHPDFGVNPAAKGYFNGDNESGGPWDSVQMGFNGRKLFTKLAFSF